MTLIGVTATVCFNFSLHFNRNKESISNNFDEHRELINNTNELPTQTPATIQELKNALKLIKLYQNAFLYVFSRLFMTTSLIYIPLWLDEHSTISTSTNVENIAIIPLISFLSSFVLSVLMKNFSNYYGHKIAYFFGSLISIIGCLWIGIASPLESSSSIPLYIVAIIFGAGSSITMISSLSITADMIGKDSNTSGFIYSAVTFADKFITGVVVIAIENL